MQITMTNFLIRVNYKIHVKNVDPRGRPYDLLSTMCDLEEDTKKMMRRIKVCTEFQQFSKMREGGEKRGREELNTVCSRRETAVFIIILQSGGHVSSVYMGKMSCCIITSWPQGGSKVSSVTLKRFFIANLCFFTL